LVAPVLLLSRHFGGDAIGDAVRHAVSACKVRLKCAAIKKLIILNDALDIRGKWHWLWRAVDNEGEALDFLVQSRRNAKAALKLVRKLLKK